jgi:hypothetical protein
MSRRSRAVVAVVVAAVVGFLVVRGRGEGPATPEQVAERRALEAQLDLARREVFDDLFARGEVVTERIAPGRSTQPTVARRGQALATDCRADDPGADGTALVRSATFDQRTHPDTRELFLRLEALGG